MTGLSGAGKTTMARILSGIMNPDSGSVIIKGLDISRNSIEVRRIIGYLSEEPHLYEDMTATEVLDFFADIYDLPKEGRSEKFKRLLGLVGLQDRKDDRIAVFSKGMRHRLALARALINDPSVLILDEPTMGLDPATAMQIREFILGMRGTDSTIFMCTHYMNEADMLCDRLAIIVGGRIVKSGTPEELKRSISRDKVLEVIPKSMSSRTLDAVSKRAKKLEVRGRRVLITLKNESDWEWMLEKMKPVSFRTVEPTLDQVFVETLAEQHEST
jgi:ABC-2 type transport system ATP-binding protein